jgi:RNA polymerase sigma-70 factor (ECF subfamily)
MHARTCVRVGPASATVSSEDLELGILFLLERLSPIERAAYLLREAFDYPYAKIADVLHTTELEARQLVSRAGRTLASEPSEPVASTRQRRLLMSFLAAARAGEFGALETLFVRGAHSLA